jgi:hypothetical protein
MHFSFPQVSPPRKTLSPMTRKVQIDLILCTPGKNENIAYLLDLHHSTQSLSIWKRFSLVGIQPTETIRHIREKIRTTFSKMYPSEGEISLLGWLKDANMADLSDDLTLEESLEERERGFICFCQKSLAVEKELPKLDQPKRGMEDWIAQEVERLLQQRLSSEESPLKRAKIEEHPEEEKARKRTPKNKAPVKIEQLPQLNEVEKTKQDIPPEKSIIVQEENTNIVPAQQQTKKTKKKKVKEEIAVESKEGNSADLDLVHLKDSLNESTCVKSQLNDSFSAESQPKEPSLTQSTAPPSLQSPSEESTPKTPTPKIPPPPYNESSIANQQKPAMGKTKKKSTLAPVAEVTPQKPATASEDSQFHTPIAPPAPATTKLPQAKAQKKKMPQPVSLISTAIPESRPQTPGEATVPQRPVVPPTPSKYQPSPSVANSLPMKQQLDECISAKKKSTLSINAAQKSVEGLKGDDDTEVKGSKNDEILRKVKSQRELFNNQNRDNVAISNTKSAESIASEIKKQTESSEIVNLTSSDKASNQATDESIPSQIPVHSTTCVPSESCLKGAISIQSSVSIDSISTQPLLSTEAISIKSSVPAEPAAQLESPARPIKPAAPAKVKSAKPEALLSSAQNAPKMPFPSIKQITLAKKSVIRSGVQNQKTKSNSLAPATTTTIQKPSGDYSADLFK